MVTASRRALLVMWTYAVDSGGLVVRIALQVLTAEGALVKAPTCQDTICREYLLQVDSPLLHFAAALPESHHLRALVRESIVQQSVHVWARVLSLDSVQSVFGLFRSQGLNGFKFGCTHSRADAKHHPYEHGEAKTDSHGAPGYDRLRVAQTRN